MILVDSGPVIAAMLQSDVAHVPVRRFLRGNTERLALLTPAIAEIAHFVEKRGGPQVEGRFLKLLANETFPIIDPILADYARAADFVEEYADFPLGTVDALIAAMAERLKVTTLLTLDRRHFEAIRPRHCERFELVP